MIFSEKLKYCRNRLGMTQNELAEKTGLHLSSIKKYETNKTDPQYPQIIKLAQALKVSPNAFIEFGSSDIRLETVGDLLGLIILLIESNFLCIYGQRFEDGKISVQSFSLKFNEELLGNILRFKAMIDTENKFPQYINDFSLEISDIAILDYLIRWESLKFTYKKFENEEDLSEASKEAMKELATNIDKIELEMQSIQTLLKTDHGGIGVKT